MIPFPNIAFLRVVTLHDTQRLHIWPEAGLRATYLSDVRKVAAG